jgi:hypothetical protein
MSTVCVIINPQFIHVLNLINLEEEKYEFVLRGVHTVTCKVVRATKMAVSSSNDWLYLALWLQSLLITFKYRQYSAIADLHTL